ncbi:hypothetical protein [Wielerella bovis]|uniref:hypothetical protein n=1 Tax=Wielerella bovis TaxID=2917790 RepID=UPI002018FB88|nr:hypothetical protein [Wielerella bovis]ULJ61292.1 hypothetical protein MIS44_05465 [Wielerella bovis]
MDKNNKISMIKTWIGIAIFLFLTAPEILGGAFAVMFILIWLLYSLLDGIRSRKQARIFGVKLACWLVAFAISYGMHHIYNHNARIHAQKIADDLDAYRAKHGHYPEHNAYNAPRQYHLRYICFEECVKNQNSPILIYSSSLIVFDRYSYDFKNKTWEHKPD